MSYKKYCDRCGEEFLDIASLMTQIVTLAGSVKYELCERCSVRLTYWMKT